MNKFFGTKLNTILLLALIILMGIAIKLMLQNKELYFHPFSKNQEPVKPNPPKNTPEISGNKDDLVSLSLVPGQKVSGIINLIGSVKGNYFFEANIGVNVLDANKKTILGGHGTATTDWMSEGPVSFEATLNLTNLPKGPAYIQIANDNPSGIEANNKFIYIPIMIE
jgi:hypothetical protein